MERNTPAFLTWTFACAGAGAVLVPLNHRLAAPELRAVLADATPRLLLAHADLRDLAEAAAAGLDGAHAVDERAGAGRRTVGAGSCPRGAQKRC